METAIVAIAIGDRIRDDIVAGTLLHGGRGTRDSLAARYSVGPMPVREALRPLPGEGLVVLTKQGLIARMSAKDLVASKAAA